MKVRYVVCVGDKCVNSVVMEKTKEELLDNLNRIRESKARYFTFITEDGTSCTIFGYEFNVANIIVEEVSE